MTGLVTSVSNCPLCQAGVPGRHPDRGGTHAGPRKEVPVQATFDRLDGSPAESREVHLYLRDDYVWMRGGPTGYESLPSNAEFGGRDWYACVGTRGRFSQCVVPATEMDRAFAELGLR